MHQLSKLHEENIVLKPELSYTHQGAKNSTRMRSWSPILLSKSSSVNSSTSLARAAAAKAAINSTASIISDSFQCNSEENDYYPGSPQLIASFWCVAVWWRSAPKKGPPDLALWIQWKRKRRRTHECANPELFKVTKVWHLTIGFSAASCCCKQPIRTRERHTSGWGSHLYMLQGKIVAFVYYV